MRKYLLTKQDPHIRNPELWIRNDPGGQLLPIRILIERKYWTFFLKFFWIFEKIVGKDLDIFTDPDPQIHYSESELRIRIPEAD